MALPRSRQEFKNKCLRNLGRPVLDFIPIDDDQIEDKIDDALQYYQDYHFDATERLIFKHQITQEDITNKFITIPENIIGISSVHELSTGNVSRPPFGVKYQIMANDFFNMASSSITPYVNTMTYISLITEILSVNPSIKYNRHVNKLYIEMDWNSDVAIGDWIIADAWGILDPNIYRDIWSDRWLLKYATALMKKQVAEHMKRYNLTLPGNVSYNGEYMYKDAVDEIMQMEAEMISSYSPLFNVYIG